MAAEWAREKAFMEQLSAAAKKPSRNTVQFLVDVSVEDEAQAYKHVSALLLRSMKRSPPERRINTFYVLSAICRQSKMQLKAADKYVPRLLPQMPAIAQMLAEIPSDQHTAIKRVLKSWRAERVFTEGALGEIESALGVVDDMMMADGGDDAEPVLADDVIAQAPAGPTSTAAELRPDPRTTAAAAALPPPALLPAPEYKIAPAVSQYYDAGVALPASSLPAPPVMLPLPTASQHGAVSSNHQQPYAPASTPAWSSQAAPASQPPSVPHTNGWQATSEPATELPGLGPDLSADRSARKRSRWSDAAQPQPTAPREGPGTFTAPQTVAQLAPPAAQTAQWIDRLPQSGNGNTQSQWEEGAGGPSVQDGYLPPPPPIQQQTGDRPGASGNGVSSLYSAPPAPQAAAVPMASGTTASRPPRRSRWESAPAAEPATAAEARARAQPPQQQQLSQPTPAALLARQAVAAPPATPPANKPVWTGEGVAPWLVAQEAAAEARRAAQSGAMSDQQSAAQPGLAQHQQGAPPQQQAALQVQAPRPGAAVPQHHLQQQQQHGRPSGLAQPRLGPPPPSMMPARPMAGPPLQQQHQHPQQQYGIAPPMAFFPGGGGHMHPGHMRPGHQLPPGPMHHPGFAPGPMHGMPPRPWPPHGPRPPPGQPSGAAGPPLALAVPGSAAPASVPKPAAPSAPVAGADVPPPPPVGAPPPPPPGEPLAVASAPSPQAAALQELYADIAGIT